MMTPEDRAELISEITEAISKIKVINTAVQNEVQLDIRTNTVYADCKHSDDGLRLLNNAITNGGPAGDCKRPTAHIHELQYVRSHDGQAHRGVRDLLPV
jgi:hypothetical protein